MKEEKKIEEIPDGHIIGEDLTISRKGGYFAVVYRCPCGREQSARNKITKNGIGRDTAQSVGWVKTDLGWLCPYCSGRSSWLDKVFNK